MDPHTVSVAQPATILVNPTSGGGRAISYVEGVRQIFAEFGIPVAFSQTNSSEEMAATVLTAIVQGCKLLIGMGGDGTLQELANASFGRDIVLGILPLGGGNDFAAAIGLPKNPIDAARLLLQGEVRLVDVLRARTADGRERLFLGGGGFGLDSEAMKYANGAFREWPGRLRYVAAAVRAFFHSDPAKMHATFPDSALPDIHMSVLLAAAMNISTYGAGLCLAPEAVIDDGSLDVVFLQDLSALDVMRLLPRLLATGELRTARISRVRAKSVRFTTEGPCQFQAEGELLGPVPVEIELLPKAIRVLAPSLHR
jgi:diacylglycerol kinase (ATP)